MTCKAISKKIVRFISTILIYSCSQWPRVLRRGSAAAPLLELSVRMAWHESFSFVGVECCQIEVSALGRLLFQNNLTECGVSECDCEALIWRRPWPTGGCCAVKKVVICNGRVCKNESILTSVSLELVSLYLVDTDSTKLNEILCM
jgi:hypothetical protein